jgi:flavin reductase (DIM6/NTAB) family NADH-FMN oxidoreductase RutF
MKHLDPKELPLREVNALVVGGVAPRPIALVSTISPEGVRNLSPFSFFNCFGINPPTVAFSASRRARDGSTKHTYANLMATRECVIQAVTYDMVQQVSLASTEYPEGVDEFAKSGLTPIPSDIVKPYRVAESPFQMECRLHQMISLGDGKGSGNLAICEVVRFHVATHLFEDGLISPDAIDLVGRNSGDFYTRARGDAIFSVRKPIDRTGIGYDRIPDWIRSSHVLTANNLGQLGNIEQLPSDKELEAFAQQYPPEEGSPKTFRMAEQSRDCLRMFRIAMHMKEREHADAACMIDLAAKCALDGRGDAELAWKMLLCADRNFVKHSNR